MAPSKKGGGFGEALLTGTALFAATKARTYPGFLWSFAQYSLVLLAIFVGVWLVAKALRIEYFDECAAVGGPSTGGDQKCTTAAGNVRIY
jgi:hypothetical protein